MNTRSVKKRPRYGIQGGVAAARVSL